MIKRLLKAFLVIMGVLLVLAIILPLVIPLPPLTNTQPVQALAEPDSRFIGVNGLQMHYKQQGSGEPAIILLHGFGASVFSWREVMEPLSSYGTVIAYDRPAFGLTSRPMPGEWDGISPYSLDAQVSQLNELMDRLEIDKAILVGNSAGGTVAFEMALRYPERVIGLVAVDAAVYNGGGAPAWMRPFLGLPQAQRLGQLAVRRFQARGEEILNMAWHDPSRITPQIVMGYRNVTRAENWDRALWQFTMASRPANLPDRLGELSMPVLVITGDDDRIVPTEESIRLAEDIPQAALVVIPNCGHVPQEECPEAFMQAMDGFIKGIAR